MKKINLFILLIFLSVTARSQYIIAGQHDSTDYYYDVIPDTTLISYHNGGPVDYEIDINGDGIMDFDLWACSCGGLGAGTINCLIIPYNNNEICFANNDSCFGSYPQCQNEFIAAFPMANAFDSAAIIDNNRIWKDTSLNLAYISFEMDCFSCSGITLGSNLYIGVRIINPTDTLYGWIKVSDVNTSGFTLYEYACNSGRNNTDTSHTDSTITKNPEIIGTYPNPVSNLINIQLPSSDSIEDLRIIDILGRIIYEKRNCGNYAGVDVSKLNQGIYFYQITDLVQTRQGKFVIIRKK